MAFVVGLLVGEGAAETPRFGDQADGMSGVDEALDGYFAPVVNGQGFKLYHLVEFKTGIEGLFPCFQKEQGASVFQPTDEQIGGFVIEFSGDISQRDVVFFLHRFEADGDALYFDFCVGHG